MGTPIRFYLGLLFSCSFFLDVEILFVGWVFELAFSEEMKWAFYRLKCTVLSGLVLVTTMLLSWLWSPWFFLYLDVNKNGVAVIFWDFEKSVLLMRWETSVFTAFDWSLFLKEYCLLILRWFMRIPPIVSMFYRLFPVTTDDHIEIQL